MKHPDVAILVEQPNFGLHKQVRSTDRPGPDGLQDLGFWVSSLGSRVQGFRVQGVNPGEGPNPNIQGLGLRVWV